MSAKGLTVHEANLEEKPDTFRGFAWIYRLRYGLPQNERFTTGVFRFSRNYCRRWFDPPGFASSAVCLDRYIMERAANLAQAKHIWETTNNTCGFNHSKQQL